MPVLDFLNPVKGWRNDSHSPAVYACAGLVIVLILLLVGFWDSAAQQRAADLAPEPPLDETADGTVTGYPVPPMDLPHYHGLDLGEPALGSPPLGSTDATKEVTGAGS